jgi:hypothetical protein
MKKLFWGLMTLIQILLVAGIFILDRISHKHMTFYRWVLLKNSAWRADFPMRGLSLALAIILAILALAAAGFSLRRVAKNRNFRFWGDFQPAGLALAAGGSAIFITINSTDNIKTYYFAVAMLLVATLLQIAKLPLFAGKHNAARG